MTKADEYTGDGIIMIGKGEIYVIDESEILVIISRQ